jgi:hypothetical protein
MPRFRGILCHGVAKFVDFHDFWCTEKLNFSSFL